MITKIKYYRLQMGLTLKELSIITGLSIGYLCHLEKGTRDNPSYNTMNKICIALNQEMSNVFILTDNIINL